MRRWMVSVCGGLLAALLISAEALPEVDVPTTMPEGPMEIVADHFEYTNGTFWAEGSVTGRFERAMLRADRLSGNKDTGEIKASGDIAFRRDDMVWFGSELEYNANAQTGSFGPSTFRLDPIYLTVGEMERVATNHYRLQDASFTTCPREHPHIHMQAKSAELIDESVVKASGMKVYVGSVPVFYFPYLKYRVSDNVFKFRAGYGSKWGAYLQTQTTLPVTDTVDSVTRIDGYSKRGLGLGQGVEWDRPGKHVGEASAYYLKDQSPYEKYAEDSAFGEQIDRNRYRLNLDELYTFSPTHYLNTRWTYLSDPAVMEEFFKKEYRNGAQPETYLSYVYGNDSIGSEVFVNKRLNDFYQNLDQIAYNLDLYRKKLGPSPFYLESKNSVAQLDMRTSSMASAATPEWLTTPYDTVRLDSENTIYAPFNIGFLNFVPRGSYRGTYYSDTATADEDEYRQIAGAGTEVSFQATKILSERDHWYGKGLRHKVEPYMDYGFYDEQTMNGNDLYAFDRTESVAADDGGTPVTDAHRVKLGLRNVFQTKRDGRLARFVDLDLFTHYRFSREPGQENFDYLYIDARMPLTQNMFLDMEGAYDWYGGQIPFFTTRYSLDKEEYIASLEHRYLKNDYSLWTPRLELFPKEKVSAELYARYNDDQNDLEEIALIGYYTHCCLRYGLGFHKQDDGDNRVMFSIALTAFPDEQISSGM